MVHVPTMQAQQEFYEAKRMEILSSGNRFAVLSASPVCKSDLADGPRFTGGRIRYFNSRKSLYKAYPCFKPDADMLIGTGPMLIDIGKETNSLAYQREQLNEEISRFSEGLVDILERGDRLAEEEKKLQELEKTKVLLTAGHFNP